MSLKAPQPGSGPKVIPPVGAHVAICYGIIDIGTQLKTFKGKDPTPTPTLVIMWEFPNLEKHVFDENKGPQPLAISNDYTVSLSEKSNLYKSLMSWRGVPPVDLEKELPLFLGQPCLLNVIHNKSADGTKTYANISGIMRLPAGMQVNPMSNQKIFFNLDNYSHDTFLKVPGWIQKKIQLSQEWPAVLAKFGNPPVQQSGEQANPFLSGAQQQVNQHVQQMQQPANTSFNQGFAGMENDAPPF